MKERFKQLDCCIILSTDAQGEELQQLVNRLLGYTDDLLVLMYCNVAPEVLCLTLPQQSLILPQAADLPNYQKYPKTRCLKYAVQRGYKHALWLDDVQHIQSQTLSVFLDALEINPGTILIGRHSNNESEEIAVPSFSSRVANAAFTFKTGIKLEVLESGYRLYPIHKMQELSLSATGAGYAREALVKAAWHKIPIQNISIDEALSIRSDKSISVGAALRNFSQLSILNTYLIALALFYYVPLRFMKVLNKENIRAFVEKNFFDKTEPIYIKALSIAFGVFMAVSPFIGFQLLLGIPLAHFMRLNKALFVTAANISIPPLIPFLMVASFKIGAMFVENAKTDLFLAQGITTQTLKANFLQYGIGALFLAAISALIAGTVAYAWLNVARSRRIALEAAAVESI